MKLWLTKWLALLVQALLHSLTGLVSCRSASNFEVAAKPRDVALRRGAELFFVVTAEVRWILVATFKPALAASRSPASISRLPCRRICF